jgi:predicted NACHT family NTPase
VPQHPEKSIDELVREVRLRAYEKIKTLHGTIGMLRVNRRVPVDNIYIDLNVLEQVSCDRTFSDWRKDFHPDSRNFDRLGLGRAIEEGVPALDIVRKYPKLMVFGKPGSGKTTFLKSLALQCIEPEGQLQWDRHGYVPIFITLQKFAKDAKKRGKFSLFDYIYHQEFCSWGQKNQQVVEAVLEQGRALVLLDGLDEVQGQEYKPVIEEIESFCERFHSNRFFITCRTQNHRYKFDGFTDVEVADFKPEQVNRFINRWFAVVVANAESEMLATELIGQLQQPENKQIAELAVTPVLLNLICSVFQGERGNLPKNRADLYKKGLRDLLEGLDESKGVQREPIYEELTPEAKEDLLAYLAVTLFEANDYFPQQETLEKLIAERLDVSRPKAIKVLRSIEEHSGLIVERSEGFWSFSHLTFQEYFAAKWFCDRADWHGFVEHITDKQWREVFLLAVEMVERTDESDKLLQLLKQKIDTLLDDDREHLKPLFSWVHQETLRIQNSLNDLSYKPAAIRAFSLARVIDIDIPPEYIKSVLQPPFDFNFNPDRYALVPNLGKFTLSYNVADALDLARIATFNLERAYWLARILDPTLSRHLSQLLQQLEVPDWNEYEGNIEDWWNANSQLWTKKLRAVIVDYRNFGHGLKFSKHQKELLQKYYDANKLLADCLNSSYRVSDGVRKKIEETLFFLFPTDEIKKRQ